MNATNTEKPLNLCEVKPIDGTKVSLITLIDPDSINEITSESAETVYAYDYYQTVRKSYDGLYEDIFVSFSSWLSSLKAHDSDTETVNIRWTISQLLSETDKYMLIDYPLEDDKRVKIIAYRKALRDISKQTGYPFNTVFPVYPNIDNAGDSVFEILEAMTF